MSLITLRDIADNHRLKRILDPRRTKAWSNAALRNPPADGVDTYEFFTGPTSMLNRKRVADAILAGKPWAPLIEDQIPKPVRLKVITSSLKKGRRIAPVERRSVNHDTRVDHARQLALRDALQPVIEGKLTRVAAAYVRGRRLEDVFTRTLITIREKKLLFTKTLDIKACFDNVHWHILDQAIDRHLGGQVDVPARGLLKASYRAPAFRRDGSSVERVRGIPQGAVLAPLLVNLYFADFDRIVQRVISNFGCTIWRYSDDMLVAGPSVDAIQKATEVIRRELVRLRLTIKQETDRVCDLRNRQNPARWLGFAFTIDRTWVPRERVERKAAQLLGDLMSGRAVASSVDERLEALRTYYAHVIHPDDADRAIASIRKLIEPHLGCVPKERKEGIERVREQIRKRAPFRWSKPAPDGDNRSETTLAANPPGARDGAFGLCQGRGGEELLKGRADGHREIRSEARMCPKAGGTPEGGSPHCQNERIGGMRAVIEDSSSGRDSGSNWLPLAAPSNSEAPPLPDRAAHREGASDKTGGDRSYAATISVSASRFEWGTLRVDTAEGSWSSPFRVKKAASAEEIVLAGYRIGIGRALRAGARHIALAVDHPTIAGYVGRAYRIRSVFVMRQWELLLRAVDAAGGLKVGTFGASGAWTPRSLCSGAMRSAASRFEPSPAPRPEPWKSGSWSPHERRALAG